MLAFATTPDGLRLPVIDVTHPAFAVADEPASLAARRDAFLAWDRRGKGDCVSQLTPRHLRRQELGTLNFKVCRNKRWCAALSFRFRETYVETYVRSLKNRPFAAE